MTRIESGEKRRNVQQTDVRALAADAIEMASIGAADKSVTVRLHAPDEVMMPADPEEVLIVLSNLVSNAVKYNRDGGTVDVTLQRLEGATSIEVADTGIGMAAEDAAGIFEDFSRIKNDRTRDIPGSGLGLSTVKKVVQLYCGEVGVESEDGKGSTFKVVLPDAEPTD